MLAMKRLAKLLTKLKKYLPSFPVSDAYNYMNEEELNSILLHAAPTNGPSKHIPKAGTLNQGPIRIPMRFSSGQKRRNKSTNR